VGEHAIRDRILLYLRQRLMVEDWYRRNPGRDTRRCGSMRSAPKARNRSMLVGSYLMTALQQNSLKILPKAGFDYR